MTKPLYQKKRNFSKGVVFGGAAGAEGERRKNTLMKQGTLRLSCSRDLQTQCPNNNNNDNNNNINDNI